MSAKAEGLFVSSFLLGLHNLCNTPMEGLLRVYVNLCLQMTSLQTINITVIIQRCAILVAFGKADNVVQGFV